MKGKMTPNAASRIQSSQAKTSNGSVDKGTFAARSQRAAAKNNPVRNKNN
jgi:hypothetical protein